MLLARIAETSAGVAGTAARLEKVELLAAALAELHRGGVPWGGVPLRHAPARADRRRLGDAASSGPRGGRDPRAARSRCGAATRRRDYRAGIAATAPHGLKALFGRATAQEQSFLAALLVGELRQGALESVMADAVARAAGIPAADVRRAAMLAGDLRAAAVTALRDGSPGLERFRLTVLRPVQPMLAQTADDVEAALERIQPAIVEWKLDGARLQVHRLGDEVRAFTRNLADVTDRVPEVVEAVAASPPTRSCSTAR